MPGPVSKPEKAECEPPDAELHGVVVADAVGEDLAVDLVVQAVPKLATSRRPRRAGGSHLQRHVALEEVTRAACGFQVLQGQRLGMQRLSASAQDVDVQ